jgi:hypothetical protein
LEVVEAGAQAAREALLDESLPEAWQATQHCLWDPLPPRSSWRGNDGVQVLVAARRPDAPARDEVNRQEVHLGFCVQGFTELLVIDESSQGQLGDWRRQSVLAVADGK